MNSYHVIERTPLWPCPKWNTSCALAVLRTYNGRCVRVSVKSTRLWCPIPHFSVQKGARERSLAAIMRPRSALLPSWCKLAADFYPTVKAALRHESADSEEDREGLECHLGQGLYFKFNRNRLLSSLAVAFSFIQAMFLFKVHIYIILFRK